MYPDSCATLISKNISDNELKELQTVGEVSFETREEDLTLTGLQSIFNKLRKAWMNSHLWRMEWIADNSQYYIEPIVRNFSKVVCEKKRGNGTH